MHVLVVFFYVYFVSVLRLSHDNFDDNLLNFEKICMLI